MGDHLRSSPETVAALREHQTSTEPLYSCLMADGPIYGHQALVWAWTLMDLAQVDPARMVVHALAGSEAAVRNRLERLGIETITVEPFETAFPHCNKLQQLYDPRFSVGEHVTIFTDTDIAFVQPVNDLARPATIAAKVVDLPNPPIEMWQAVLNAAALPTAAAIVSTTFGNHPTPIVNRNGGLYVLPGEAVAALRTAWPRWARWLMERTELLPNGFQVHIDQVSFGLAVLAEGLTVTDLRLEDNCPTTLPDLLPNISPRILHYHDRLDPSGFLLPVGKPAVDAAISRVNVAIAHRQRAGFDNRTFWDFRYKQAPELGSGVGSRGGSLSFKRTLIRSLVKSTDTVLDVGCGDLEVTRDLVVSSYTGVDVSAEALALARSKRPDWQFVHGRLGELDLDPVDVAISFDVLIHQPTRADYDRLLTELVRLTRRQLVVSGYNEPPQHQSEITFFYEPLTTSLGRLAAGTPIEIAGTYRDVTVVVLDLTARRLDERNAHA